VLCANHVEPVLGFLARYLRRRVVDATVQRNQSNRRHGEDDNSERMERVVDWIPRVWQHLNKFLETHSSTEVTVGQLHLALHDLELSSLYTLSAV